MAGRKKAEPKEKPREHVIEVSPSDRATCRSCDKLIADGELRLAEAYVSDEGRWARSHAYARTPRPSSGYDSGDDRGRHYDTMNPDLWQRYHHLACAARREPYKLRSALAATKLEIPERAELEAAIERALSGSDVAQENPATRDEYERFATLLAESRDAADADETVLVFADWLQSVGDPRGELINVQHALESAADGERARLAESEKRLFTVNRKKLLPDAVEASLTWRRGFVHRMVIADKGLAMTGMSRAFTHPSLRLVRELAVEVQSTWVVATANLPKPLPPTLRALEIGGTLLGQVDGFVTDAVPQLERLSLRGAGVLSGLRHPTLRTLELACADATEATRTGTMTEMETLGARVAGLDRKALPSLRRLVIRVERGLASVLTALHSNSLLGALDELVLAGDLTSEAIELLARSKAKLELLDVRGCRPLIPAELDQLRRVARTVETNQATAPVAAAPKPVGDWLVRHTRKPEWGIGRVVEELDDGLEVEFEQAGKRHVRNVELLEDVKG